jgi:hypothetical protein
MLVPSEVFALVVVVVAEEEEEDATWLLGWTTGNVCCPQSRAEAGSRHVA